MTPEEIQRKIEFIIESQANSAVRMDRFEEQQKTTREDLAHQKDNIDGLMSLAQKLLEVARVEQETRKAEIKAEREARMAEIEAERAKVDSIEEMTRVLRELLEANLRRPEEPPHSTA